MDANTIIIDRFLGGLYGVAIGDALGAPHEFARGKPKLEYNGVLQNQEVKVWMRNHFMIIKPHSITDDTEMTIVLLKSILDQNGYNRNHTIEKYLQWANLENTPLGKNTRMLMKGVKTVKGYQKRYDEMDTSTSQSNGTLMRCYPLVLLPDWKEASDVDVNITNPNPVNRECNLIYLGLLQYFIFGEKPILSCKCAEIRKVIQSALDGQILDVSVNKGWVVWPIYVSLITLLNTSSFEEGMDYINKHFFGTLKHPSDTDTIMAIAGGLLGARYGISKMEKEKKTKKNIVLLDKYFENNKSGERPALSQNLIQRTKVWLRDMKNEI